MRRISGFITVVQEGRFRLVSDEVRSLPFTISGDEVPRPQDLVEFLAGPRVEVLSFTNPDRKDMTAHGLEAASADGSGR